MGENNGNFKIMFWIMTFLVATSFTWTTWCYFNNTGKIERLTEISNHNISCIKDTMISIDRRLYRIELAHNIIKEGE